MGSLNGSGGAPNSSAVPNSSGANSDDVGAGSTDGDAGASTSRDGEAGSGGSIAGPAGSGGLDAGSDGGISGRGANAGTSSAGDGAGGVSGGGASGAGAGGATAGAGEAGKAGAGGAPSTACGNGIVSNSEACDDGNHAPGDGCSATCTVEPGFACAGLHSWCSTRPSCVGLPKTCGTTDNGDCCAANAVTGGTFNRLNNSSYPATVSNFGLDNYEITVGRFRKFVAVYTPGMIPEGAGKNSHNPSDPGWDPSWNASLPQTTSALIALVTFPSPTSSEVSSWTDAPAGAEVENRAMNFLSWAIAEAFCIWDGGRLPTVAEWWYAAVGGSEQRVYPWGAEVPGQNTELSVFNCLYNDGAGKSSGYCKIAGLAPVGFAPAGNGKWGQSDLSGGLTEWVQDYRPLSGLHPVPCVDCANLNRQGNGKLGYGPNYDYQFAQTVSQTETSGLFNRGMFYMGARCARNAP